MNIVEKWVEHNEICYNRYTYFCGKDKINFFENETF